MTRDKGLLAYIAGISCLTVAVLLYCAYTTVQYRGHRLELLGLVLLFAGLGWLGSQRRVLVSQSSDHVMGTTAQIATLISLPLPAAAILTIAIAKSMSELTILVRYRSRTLRGIAVNLSGTLLANAACLAIYELLQGDHYIWRNGPEAVLAVPGLLVLALTYHFVGMSVVAGAITLSTEDRITGIFLRIAKDTFLPEMSLVLTGIIFAILWHFRPGLSLFVIVPVLMSIRSFESLARLRKETVEAVIKMAESIDLRDTGTSDHSKRIADMTKLLAEGLRLTPEHTNDVILASRVHDLGKIGISNDILLKQGPLTFEEREIMKNHTTMGAGILESYSAFKGSVAIVKHHHERWDGNGYPDGLKAEEIPIGARIIGVVDAFDAMTEDRPYRDGMSADEAVRRLKQGIGSQFDPRICGAFIQLLIEQGIYEPEIEPVTSEERLRIVSEVG